MVRLISSLILLIITFSAQGAAPSVNNVMQKTASTLTATSGVTVVFEITGTHSLSGTLISQGNKFYIDAGKTKIWYDGTTMTTLNGNTSEATITHPSVAEVNETYPLSYIRTWDKDYTASYANQQPSGAYCVILTAKSKTAIAKKGVLTVNSSNYHPRKLVISLKKGGTATIIIKKMINGGIGNANGFRFPQKKYPKIKIVDLR